LKLAIIPVEFLTARENDLKINVIKTFFQRSHALAHWVLNLFDPPPLVSMTLAQKFWRVMLLSGTLVVGSILVAMLGALGLFIMEKGRELGSTPEFLQGLLIIVIGVCVNAVCVIALFQMKRADHKVMPPPDKSAKRVDPGG
jgi:uncharacterized membrane protein YidH (DUF202 family)